MAKIAIIGHGVVGSGVAELLIQHADTIRGRAREELDVSRILDLRSFPDLPYADRFTTDFEQIVNDPEISIVAEAMGGLHPAYEFVSRCLEAGKSVVTSNKELVAEKGAALLALAKAHKVNFLFEASVGGGIPVLHPMMQCLAANRFSEISGILNGTTNFILTKMIREHMTFADALALAQQLGYAERNPAADVEGIDACRKICILASIAFGHHIYPKFVHTEGITQIALADVAYADRAGYAVKLIGHADRQPDGRVNALVAPFLIPHGNPLSVVDDVFNAIMVTGDATGDVLFYGKGAGKLPTASAVVSDIIECAKHPQGCDYADWTDGDGSMVCDAAAVPYARYLRCDALTPDAVRAAFGEVQPINGESADETAFLTAPLTDAQLQSAIAAAHASVRSVIRVLAH